MKKQVHQLFSGKKKRGCALIAAVVLAVVLSVGTPDGFAAAKDNNAAAVENINLTVTDCNVAVKTSGNDVFTYEIDKARHNLTVVQDGATMRIGLKPTGRLEKSAADMATIFIPEKQYDKITVTGNRAGISLPPLNADFQVTGSGCAMSMHVSSGFQKTIQFTCKNGSGSFHLSPLQEHYTLQLTTKSSAVSVPSEWPKYTFQPRYTCVKGDGKATIDLNIEESAFSVSTDKESAETAPAELPVSISKLEGVRKYGPFQMKKGSLWTPRLTWEGRSGGVYVASQLTSEGDSFANGPLQQRTESGGSGKPVTVPSDGAYWIFVGVRGGSTIENVKGSISFQNAGK